MKNIVIFTNRHNNTLRHISVRQTQKANITELLLLNNLGKYIYMEEIK